MTILYSIYTGDGLVWAADRMILRPQDDGSYQVESVAYPKVFRVPGVGDHNQGALIGFFGQAYVGDHLMGTWLPARAAEFGGNASLAAFGEYVVHRFRMAAAAVQRHSPLGFHLGGFERIQGNRVPVFYFVRNAELNPDTGEYERLHANWRFEIEEQCLSQLLNAFPLPGIRQGLRLSIQHSYGIPMWFRNGDVPGFANVTGALEAGIRGTLQQRAGYKVPSSIQKWMRLGKLLVTAATTTAAIYYTTGPPLVGGRADALILPWDDT